MARPVRPAPGDRPSPCSNSPDFAAEAIRLGIDEILQNRREVKIHPVTLKASEEVRLQRIAKGAVLRGATLFLEPPGPSPATAIARFLRTLWPPSDDPPETP